MPAFDNNPSFISRWPQSGTAAEALTNCGLAPVVAQKDIHITIYKGWR